MKQTLFPLLIATLGLTIACTENEHPLYSGDSAVYFSETTSDDSLQYSFASGLKQRDTISIPIKIIGQSEPEARTIDFDVNPQSTAVEGTHYTFRTSQITLPAGEVETTLDVIVMDNDPELEHKTVELIVELQANDNFELGFSDNLRIRLIITKQLVKPTYWEMPLSLYYGSYSKAKHRLCIQIQGFDFPDKFDMDMVEQYISYGRLVYNSLLRNPIWDEETQTYITADWIPL
jgi:hypothetical protein